MKTKPSLVVLTGVITVVVAMSSMACEEMSKPPSPPAAEKPAAKTYGAAYVDALAVADKFCQAWLAHDIAIGKSLLSRRLLRQHPDRLLHDVIAPATNLSHKAYEIFDGRKLGPERVEFKVRFFVTFSGGAEDRPETIIGRILMDREAAGPWLVDDFPFTRSNVSLDRP